MNLKSRASMARDRDSRKDGLATSNRVRHLDGIRGIARESKVPHGPSIAASVGGAGALRSVERAIEPEHFRRSWISLQMIAESANFPMGT